MDGRCNTLFQETYHVIYPLAICLENECVGGEMNVVPPATWARLEKGLRA